MNKQFLAIIIAIVVGLFGILTLTKKDNNSQTGGTAGNSSNTPPSEHVTGKTDAKVTLVEYGDFQCPACKSYFPLVEQIKQEYKDKLTFQFRHFPLTQIHPNAFVSSRAAEAAGKQGKFFEMYELLYTNQDSWSTSSSPTTEFEAYAKQLNLNIDQFKADSQGASVADTINADTKAGQALGVKSTPSFVINGKRIEKNPQSVEEFKKLIDDALAQ